MFLRRIKYHGLRHHATDMKILLYSLSASILTFCVTGIFFFKPANLATLTIVGETINFQTRDGGFVFSAMPSKGRDYEMMERVFAEYKKQKNLPENTILYRTTLKNYLNVAKWCQYKGMPEWHYPYLWNPGL